MSNPFFSIIVPVYNTEKELERCVYSVTKQTFNDLELILVDDGSKDRSGEIIDRLAEEDSRIVAIHKENSGCSEARNTGIGAAKGRYLIFVDSDDMWDDSNALTELYDVIEEKGMPEVVCFGVSLYDEKGKFTKSRTPKLSDYSVTKKEDILRELVYTNQYISTSYVKALRKDFFDANRLTFIKGLLSEDIEWSARIMINCRTMAVYPNAFYKRIARAEGSITSSIGKKNITDIVGSIERGIPYVDEHAENDTMKDLYHEYWAYQYAMLLGLVQIIKDDSDFDMIAGKLEEYKWLLKYDHVKKVRLVHRLVNIIGVRKAIWVLSKYYRI